MKLLLKIRNFLFLLTLALVPVLFLPKNIDQFRFIRAAVLFINTSFLVLIQVYLNLNGLPLLIPQKTINKFIFSFLIFYFVSFSLSIHRFTSFWGIWGLYVDSLLYQTVLVAFFFCAFQYLGQKDSFKKISKALILSGTIVSLLAIYQYFFYGWPRPKAMLGGANFLAYFVGAMLPFNVFFISQQKKQINKIYYLLLLFINLFTFVLSYSRNGWFLFAASASLVLFLRRKRIKSWSKNFFLVLLIILPILLVFNRSIFLRIVSIKEDLQNQFGSFPIRMAEQQTAVKLFFSTKPFYQYLLGTGPSTLTYTILKVRPLSFNYLPEMEKQRIALVRNQYLQFLNTNGFFGLLCWSLIIVFTFLIFLKNKKDSLIFYPFISWFFLVLSYFFTSQTFESGLLFWTFLAMIFSRANKSEKKINFSKPAQFFPVFLIIFFSVFTLGFACFSVLAEYYASQGKYGPAAKINPYNDFYWREWALRVHQGAYSKEDFEQMSKAADLAQKAYQLNSLEPRNLNMYSMVLYHQAVIFKTKERLPEALKLNLDWVNIDPSNPKACDAVGLNYLEMIKPADALGYFLKSIEIDRNFALGFAHSGEAYKQLGKFEEAIQAYQKALELAPGWPVAQEELNKIIKLKTSLDK